MRSKVLLCSESLAEQQTLVWMTGELLWMLSALVLYRVHVGVRGTEIPPVSANL